MPPIIVAHRGNSRYAPENTLAAFREAIEIGAGAIETDLHLSADGYPVLMHDDLLDRTTSGKGAISACSLEELRALDAGSWKSPDYCAEGGAVVRRCL